MGQWLAQGPTGEMKSPNSSSHPLTPNLEVLPLPRTVLWLARTDVFLCLVNVEVKWLGFESCQGVCLGVLWLSWASVSLFLKLSKDHLCHLPHGFGVGKFKINHELLHVNVSYCYTHYIPIIIPIVTLVELEFLAKGSGFSFFPPYLIPFCYIESPYPSMILFHHLSNANLASVSFTYFLKSLVKLLNKAGPSLDPCRLHQRPTPSR